MMRFATVVAGLFALIVMNVFADKEKALFKERLSWNKWTDGKGGAILPFLFLYHSISIIRRQKHV